MPATLIDSDAVGFADGNAGHVYNFPAGAPAVGELDVIGINSDTTVSTPPGFTLPANGSRVNNQGHYLFYRFAVGGEAASVTVTTNGNFNAALRWSRFSGVDAFEVAANAGLDSSSGTSTPAVSTGVLSTTTMLVVADAGLHGNTAGTPTDPVWANAYTAMESITQGLGGAAANGFSAYKTPVGTAAETPSVSWTNPQSDRYIIVAAFTTLAGATVAPDGIAIPVALGEPTVSGDLTVAPDGITVPVTLGNPTVEMIVPPSPLGIDLALVLAQFVKTCLCDSVALLTVPPQHCRFQVGNEGFAGIDLYTDECCEGVAYVAMGDIYPSWNSFPDADIVRQANNRCVIPAWAVDFKLGIMRCSPRGTEATTPTDAEWNAAALLNIADAQALRRATCCIRTGLATAITPYEEQFDGMSMSIGRQSSPSPQGGCMERYVTVTIQFINCEAC